MNSKGFKKVAAFLPHSKNKPMVMKYVFETASLHHKDMNNYILHKIFAYSFLALINYDSQYLFVNILSAILVVLLITRTHIFYGKFVNQ